MVGLVVVLVAFVVLVGLVVGVVGVVVVWCLALGARACRVLLRACAVHVVSMFTHMSSLAVCPSRVSFRFDLLLHRISRFGYSYS